MCPILLKTRFFTIYSYGVFVALAFLASSWLLTREARRRHLDENLIYNLCLLSLASGIIFARAFYVVLRWDEFRADLWEILRLNHGGLVWFGGFIGATLAAVCFARWKRLSAVATLDLFVPFVALGQSIGRLGCFFNGCCYGRPTPWGFYFPSHAERLFPSQLIDSFTLLVLFIFLRGVQEKGRRGLTVAAYLAGAGLQRFLMEFLRADERPFYAGLSIFQWISLGVFVLGVLSGTAAILWKKKEVS